jgi:DNA-binding CsgD family transcriptional regulator
VVAQCEVVGREQELQVVRAFAAECGDGFEALVLEGEAGIGKTTLLDAAIAAASGAMARVLVARPAAAEVALAFSGLGDLFADVLDGLVPELPEVQAAALEIALLRREALAQPLNPLAVSAAVLGAFRALANRDAVVVVVDDVQWLDRETAGALAFACRRLGDVRLRLVVSLRLGPDVAPPELIQALSPERVIRLPIGALSIGALHRVIRLKHGEPLPRPVLQGIHELSAGNPFQALQLAGWLTEQRLRADPQLPPSLERLTRERLARLPEAVRRVLEPAALLRAPTVPLLQALSREPQRVAGRLDRAVAANVIEISAEMVRFSHPLLAEAMASMTGPHRRARLHADLARLVDDPEQRARHLALSNSVPSADTADQIATGARTALERGAPAAAAELLEIAVALTPAGQQSNRWRRIIEAARAHKAAGLPAVGRGLLENCLAEIPAGLPRADALVALAELSNDDFETADRALAQALTHAHTDDERLSAIHRERAYACSSHVGYEAALRHAQLAVAAAKRAGKPRVLIPALTFLAALQTWAGRVQHAPLRRALELQRRERHRFAYTFSPNVVLGLRHMSVDCLDEARDLFTAEATEAERAGDDYTYSSLLVYLAELECRAGNFGAAAAHASECWLRSEQRGERYQGGAVLWAKAWAAAHLGRVDDARAAAQQGIALSTEIGEEVYRVLNLVALGFVELSLGDVVRADALLRPLPPRLVELGWDEPSLFPAWPNAIEALVAIGERELAREYLVLYEERARRCRSPWALATAARCHGLLHHAAGDTEAALAAYAQALYEHRRTPGPFERSRTLLALGSAQRKARHRKQARETLHQALTIFEELGATLWAQKTRAESARIGGRPPSTAQLTPSEQRIAEVVAAGNTNKEVAAMLILSERTVESALTQIYRKLDVRSRTELARKLPMQD